MTYVRIVLISALALPALAACSHDVDGPKPALDAPSRNAKTPPVDPEIICRDQITSKVTVHGSGFSPVPIDIPDAPKTALPSVILSRAHALTGKAVSSPEEVRWSGDPDDDKTNTVDAEGDPLLRWKSREALVFNVNQRLTVGEDRTAVLPEGVYDVTIENPNGYHATSPASLAVVARPQLDMLAPNLTCLAQGARPFEITAQGLLRLADETPALEIDGKTQDVALELSECDAIAHKGIDAELCGKAELELAQDALDPELYPIALLNPETAACHTEEDITLRVVPPPVIDSVSPSPVCVEDVDENIVVHGSGFLNVDDMDPHVTVDGNAVDVVSLDECDAVETQGHDVQSCKAIDLGTIVADLGAGTHDVAVENPEPAGCEDAVQKVLRILPPPTVNSLANGEICADSMQTVVILGKDFAEGAKVRAGSVMADMIDVVDDTRIEATFTMGLPAGTYDITVQTGVKGCIGMLTAALTVDPAPLVFFIDPPVVYNQVAIDATVFTSGLSTGAALDTIELVDGDGKAIALMVVDNPKPNRIVAHIPGLDGSGDPTLAAGDYSVRVTNKLGCSGELTDGLHVSDTTTDSLLASIAPSFVAPDRATAVTLTGSGFVALPRLYISPSGGTGTARALRAVTMQSGTTLTAIVPGDATAPLAAGVYDLIAVNPDGTVDVLVGGLTITGAPPAIDNVIPASLVDNAATTVTVKGSGFDVDEVVLDCKESGGTRVSVTGTVQGTPTATEVRVQFDPSAAAPSAASSGSVCLVRLTNMDGAFFEYSAVSVTNSSLNLSPWSDATDMTTARRALSLAAGRPTATSRFLYAIGGDNGASGNATSIGSTVFASVESASVDVFGTMSAWAEQRTALPAPRTWAGAAAIGRFVYLVGGHDGTSATDTLYRAQILDPLAGPAIEDLDGALGDGKKGLGGGLWLYRVAAVFPTSDASNPDGESLAGELLPVQLPDRDEKIQLTLTWTQVAGASGYRVYRSKSVDAGADELELLAEVSDGDTVNYTDVGGKTMAGKPPLPPGSLGAWHAVDGARCTGSDCALGTKREALATVAVQDPAAAGTYYLYAIGGRDQAGTYLDTFEYATVTIAADGSQTVADFTPGGDTLVSPRAELGVWVMSASNSSVIRSSGTPNDVWLYVGGGRTTAGAFDRNVEAALLGGSGALGAFTDTDDLNGDLAGLGAGASNDQLYTFGGKSGASDGTSASLCAGGGGCAALPDLQPGSWNSLGSATAQRIYMGATQESAFFFLAGGHDGTNTLATSEQTVQ